MAAHCNFTIPVPESAEELLETARRAIESHKGTFTGDITGGHFHIFVGIGDIDGHYTIADGMMNIHITKKPLLVSCKVIEKRLRGYLKAEE